jgi:hypothetical protein
MLSVACCMAYHLRLLLLAAIHLDNRKPPPPSSMRYKSLQVACRMLIMMHGYMLLCPALTPAVSPAEDVAMHAACCRVHAKRCLIVFQRSMDSPEPVVFAVVFERGLTRAARRSVSPVHLRYPPLCLHGCAI